MTLVRVAGLLGQDSPAPANQLADLILGKVEQLREHPDRYRAGRKRGTREMVVYPHYSVIHRVQKQTVEILRVKHSAQRWPAKEI